MMKNKINSSNKNNRKLKGFIVHGKESICYIWYDKSSLLDSLGLCDKSNYTVEELPDNELELNSSYVVELHKTLRRFRS